MDLWDGVKKGLSTVAPLLANAVLPGSGGVVGSLVSGVLGCDNKPEAITTALANATPEQKVELIKIQNTHEENLVKLASENDKIYLQDVQQARDREIAIVKATGKKDYNLYILAWTVIVGFFLLVYFMMYVTLPEKNIGPVNQLFGALATGFGMVLSYFFGSSKSSKDKTAMLGTK